MLLLQKLSYPLIKLLPLLICQSLNQLKTLIHFFGLTCTNFVLSMMFDLWSGRTLSVIDGTATKP